MRRLLVIEQDERMLAKLIHALSFEEFQLEHAASGKEAVKRMKEASYDLILSADRLSDLVGEQLLIELRYAAPQIPVILLTASRNTKRRVRYYRLGANDVMNKPVDSEELVARVLNLLRLIGKDERVPIQIDSLRIDPIFRRVEIEGEFVALTPTEFHLLYYLAKNEGKALSREQILSEVWGYEFAGDTNLVDVYIRYLRLKIDKKIKKKLISTVRGVGYLFAIQQN